MTQPIYTASIPVFTQMLGGLQTVVRKAEAHATEKKIDPNAFVFMTGVLDVKGGLVKKRPLK